MNENSNNEERNDLDLKKRLKQLNAPYKKSKAYETFGDVDASNDKASVFWNSKVDYVVKYENARIDNLDEKLSDENKTNEHNENNMVESQDKNIPLMEPTNFEENDPRNPKYVSLEEKKETLKEKNNHLDYEDRNIVRSSALSLTFSAIIAFTSLFIFTSKYNMLSDIELLSFILVEAGIVCIPTILALVIRIQKTKKLAKEIKRLENEIEEETRLKKEKEKSKVKEELKSLSKETKNLLSDLSENKELSDVRKTFGMSYDEFLKIYEMTNAFQDEEELDKAVESLSIIDNNEETEKSTTKRKRYKITGRKLKQEQQN